MAEVTAQGKMAAPSTAIRRRRSFAQSDMVRYRRSFDLFDLEKEGRVRGDKLGDVVHQLGYRLTDDQLKVRIVYPPETVTIIRPMSPVTLQDLVCVCGGGGGGSV